MIRRSNRVRRVRIQFRSDGTLEVVAPPGISDRSIARAVADAGPWIDRVAARRAAIADLGLGEPGVVRVFDRRYPVVRESGRSKIEHGDGVLLVRATDDEDARRLVRSWYLRVFKDSAVEAVSHEARAMGVSPGRISVREMQTRWGSCNPRTANMSLNWRLVLAPSAIGRYVVVHELAHLRHANHSEAFWRLVAEHDSEVPAHRRWLRAHGPQLLAYDPASAIR